MKEIIVEKVIDGVSYKLRTGKLAKQADGSVVAQAGDTMVLATAVASKKSSAFMDFFPLTVEFREKTYAAGKIPGGFIKRESRPSNDEILTARTIDRPIRPLFEQGFKAETQLIVSAISYDRENPFDVLGVTAASAALLISDIPFNIPVAAVRIIKKDGEFKVNPSHELLENCDINLDIAGTKDGISMVESEAKEASEEDMVKALEIGHEYIKKLIDLQFELKELAGKPKRPIEIIEPLDEKLIADIKEKIIPELKEAVSIKMKLDRSDRLSQIFNDYIQPSIDNAESEDKERTTYILKNLFENTIKEVVRKKIVSENIRIDGRKLDEIRKITCELDILPRAHGSSLFTRGETQSLGVATLGSSRDEQMEDGLVLESSGFKKFYLHYNFPPFCVGEVKRVGSVSRREIGHGNLAERALKMVLPAPEDFPYTIRLVSEVLESNGSSSMASICSGSMALMAAGVPLKHQVAGIAMGLIEESDDYYVISDILGDEDHFGDMDFKVAGTENGITALQMDIKIKSLPLSVMAKALAQANTGRKHILSIMNSAINNPRKELSEYAPRIESIMVNPDKIKDVIGPGGKMIKSIIEQTGVDIDIDSNGSGEVKIISNDSVMAEKAKRLVLSIVKEVEVDEEYKDSVVTRIMDFGAFVKITPTKEGLVHISQIAAARVNKVTDVLNVGDKIDVKVIKIDEQGRINLSRKAMLEE
ncbi:MAG: polyribonucleotide nucleotidyltransferase [Candidatus Muirbacterium halophilum]|nr:polyribonucleotide nucleotidyltransferase [Candidatus Muirbacterium halophilum]MCK9474464.1 polyribonucleotide nucleotidyltransferase [Candidatus Muirbacterium halophilum]